MSIILGYISFPFLPIVPQPLLHLVAAAAKSFQPCPTLCDPIDGSPPGSPVPGILQERTLEWVAISFSIFLWLVPHLSLNDLFNWSIIALPGGSNGKESSAMWGIWVPSLGLEVSLEEGTSTPSSILAWRIPMDRGAWRATVRGVTKSWT